MNLRLRSRAALLLFIVVIPFTAAGQTQSQPAPPPVASHVPAPPAGPAEPKLKDVNPEILRLVIEDQWDRGNDMFGKGQVRPASNINWKVITERDAERHKAARKLLAEGQLQSGSDYFFASLIFQHSEKPDDLLLAHVLAVTAVAKGKSTARWMAAATLDRYLHSIGKPQVFGTQFYSTGPKKWTMEPYDQNALSDAERALWCVVPLARQNAILAALNNGEGNASTSLPDCK